MTFEEDVYHAPKYFKKAGKLLLKAARKGEYAYIKQGHGSKPMYDFDRDFFYHLKSISKDLLNLHHAYTKLFTAINSNSSTDLIRSIGRLDGAIAALVDSYQLASSYEVQDGDFMELEQVGVESLTKVCASLIEYAVEVEACLGKQLIDIEATVNENPEVLNNRKHTITINFDSAKCTDKLSELVEWYKGYKQMVIEAEDSASEASEMNGDIEHDANLARVEAIRKMRYGSGQGVSIDPVDAAVIGYVVGLEKGS